MAELCLPPLQSLRPERIPPLSYPSRKKRASNGAHRRWGRPENKALQATVIYFELRSTLAGLLRCDGVVLVHSGTPNEHGFFTLYVSDLAAY